MKSFWSISILVLMSGNVLALDTFFLYQDSCKLSQSMFFKEVTISDPPLNVLKCTKLKTNFSCEYSELGKEKVLKKSTYDLAEQGTEIYMSAPWTSIYVNRGSGKFYFSETVGMEANTFFATKVCTGSYLPKMK